jgi:hypothetical protein
MQFSDNSDHQLVALVHGKFLLTPDASAWDAHMPLTAMVQVCAAHTLRTTSAVRVAAALLHTTGLLRGTGTMRDADLAVACVPSQLERKELVDQPHPSSIDHISSLAVETVSEDVTRFSSMPAHPPNGLDRFHFPPEVHASVTAVQLCAESGSMPRPASVALLPEGMLALVAIDIGQKHSDECDSGWGDWPSGTICLPDWLPVSSVASVRVLRAIASRLTAILEGMRALE